MESRSILVVFRTHLWNEAVELCFRSLVSSTRHPIVISVDETRGTIVTPEGIRKIAHTQDTFRQTGLPLFPTAERSLWFNGDYALYQVADETGFDHLFWVESDCAISGPLDDVIDALAAENADYAVKNFAPRRADYKWYPATARWFARHHHDAAVHGGIWPSGFISRKAIHSLQSARRTMAREVGTAEDWVHVEAFVATHLQVNGFRCKRLSSCMDMSQCTVHRPLRADALGSLVEAGRVQSWHPVLTSPRYEEKLAIYADKQSRALAQANRKLARWQAAAADLATDFGKLEREAARLRAEARRLQERAGKLAD